MAFVLEQQCTKINPQVETRWVDVLGSVLKALRELSETISASSNFQGLLSENTPFNIIIRGLLMLGTGLTFPKQWQVLESKNILKDILEFIFYFY